MTNKELLQRIETAHHWIANSIIKLRQLVENEDKFTQESINQIRNEILTYIQLTITEYKILELELEAE